MASAGGRSRRRRSPEEAEGEILGAAEAFLRERPFREMRVDDLMARTTLSRPAFYAYFRDRYGLVGRLLERIGGELFEVDRRWLEGEGGSLEEAREVLRETVRGGVTFFVEYGPVLRAVSDAAGDDPQVEGLYRRDLVEEFVGAVASRVSRDAEAGLSPGDLDPEQVARALVWMTERYLLDAFGRPAEWRSQPEVVAVTRTVESIWLRTLYGSK